MKKFLALIVALMMLCSMVSAFAEDGTGVYTIYNSTGETLTGLYIYVAGSEDKGTNLAEGYKDGTVFEYTAAKDAKLTVEFTTESGYTGTFNTLSIETAPINLLAADAMTGATAISFFVPERTATYTIYNVTGEKVTELYAINALTGEKGENYAGENGLRNNKVVTIEKTVAADKTGKADFVIDLTYVTESGRTGSFPTLHFETVPIALLSTDAMTGATAISFSVPQATGVYTFYNCTKEALKELYVYANGSEDKGTNYAEGFEDGLVVEFTANIGTTLTVDFTTESGFAGSFNTLAIETAPISLLSADTMTGATFISFSAPAN